MVALLAAKQSGISGKVPVPRTFDRRNKSAASMEQVGPDGREQHRAHWAG
jgi:hypothetical protein